ncbi:HD-GYP domain-containing protein [Jeotgalibacillus haloalkalitolerans]|uniref:HD-GYP domain-containing protein n=1 Tax=Jeotgalibacillus haloalkalitolerans TaxID=3104292 RepID=A0ABU5KH51_9BACL|nr:HD-GYP domain-containing protein [Jeotgalibacillus sp. HH7-29]MDZ5710583.1 HD-GYP domain-containing protein [Jeotgalibacillus sp. HH7-29]
MKVSVHDLTEGCRIAQDIMGLTANPIIKKGTELSSIHFEALRAFNIQHVEVYSKLADGSKVEAEPVREEAGSIVVAAEEPPLKKQYMELISYYNGVFNAWQSGGKLDIVALKSRLMPLLRQVAKHKDVIYQLHRWSEAKSYIAHHSVSTAIISYLLAEKAGYDQGGCIQLAVAGILTDTGMAKMPLSILKKSGPLTQEEAIEIRKHPLYSYQYIMDSPLLKNEMKAAILQHHERLDGSGYPKGSRGKDISRSSQVLALADVFHAMTSERLYRAKKSPFRALEIIWEDELGKFDIALLKALQEIVGGLATGTRVILSDDRTAEVIFTQPQHLLRPMIKAEGSEDIIDLTKERKLYIEQVIS